MKPEELMVVARTLDDAEQDLLVQAQDTLQQGREALEQLVTRLTRKLELAQNEISFLKQTLAQKQMVSPSSHPPESGQYALI